MGRQQDMYVTRTRAPRPDGFFRRCEAIFQDAQFANNGPCVRELERALGAYLDVPQPLLCNNGTTALMLAASCAGLAGKKVALTPYTYVATLSALLWIGCTPVFVDIDPATLSLSPELLKDAFAREPDIAGVMPVHIYGLACDVDAIGAICAKNGARLVYDAAQAFGSRYKGRSLLDFGEVSACSFHATKLFHTAEGGCLVTRDRAMREALHLARAFGHRGDKHISLGINGKMSELHAALGLEMLEGVAEEIARRRAIHALYDAALADLPLVRPRPLPGLEWNCAYYPVLFPDEAARKGAEEALAAGGVHPRRYFYPALNTLPYLRPEWRRPCPVAEDAARRVLCLPLHGEMDEEDVARVARLLQK